MRRTGPSLRLLGVSLRSHRGPTARTGGGSRCMGWTGALSGEGPRQAFPTGFRVAQSSTQYYPPSPSLTHFLLPPPPPAPSLFKFLASVSLYLSICRCPGTQLYRLWLLRHRRACSSLVRRALPSACPRREANELCEMKLELLNRVSWPLIRVAHCELPLMLLRDQPRCERGAELVRQTVPTRGAES